MKLSETAKILAIAASVEGQEATELQVATWHRLLADVPFDDAIGVVTDHYRTESRRIWPADIRRATVDSVGRDEWLMRS